MATVREIAQRLDISTATVSRVLNSRPGIGPETRRRVMEAASEMGFDRNVGLKSSRYIGFIHPLGHFIGNMGEYHSALLGGIATSLGQGQYDLALIDPYRDKRPDESYTQFFYRKELRGVLIQVRPHNEGVARAIADEGFPMVLIANKIDHPNINWVVCDSAGEYTRAVEYLVRMGHRRIALSMRTGPDFDHEERLRGYCEAHQKLGLPIDPELILRIEGNNESGAAAIRLLRSLTRPPTAIMFTNAAPTCGALRACRELGIDVPKDLSIIGFDDDRKRYDIDTPFTAVCQDAKQLGIEASSWLMRYIDGQVHGPLRLTLPTIFEVHKTTGPAPQNSI